MYRYNNNTDMIILDLDWINTSNYALAFCSGFYLYEYYFDQSNS